MASTAVCIKVNVESVVGVALDKCNLIITGELSCVTHPLIGRPVLGGVDDLTPAAARRRPGIKQVRWMTVHMHTVCFGHVYVPGIVAGRAVERTGRPSKHQAGSLELITGLTRCNAVKRIVVEHRDPAANAASAKRRSCVKVVIVNF